MPTIAKLPFAWIEFDKAGGLLSALPPWATDGTVTDVVILSHGWKTDAPGASKLYQPLVRNIVKAWDAGKPGKPAGRSYGVLGLLWPSKRFDADDERPIDFEEGGMDDGEGGGLAAGAGGGVRDLDGATMNRIVAAYADFVGADRAVLLAAAEKVADEGFTSANAVDLMRAATDALQAPPASDDELAEARSHYGLEDAKTVLESLSDAPSMPVSPDVGAAAGVGSFFGKLLAGPKAAVARLLNQLTYFEMKTRAGKVGEGAANTIVRTIAGGQAQRMHLVGHSFGARLVTAATFFAERNAKVRSLTMLQGAFSHNALSRTKGGAFADAHKRFDAVTLITHTHNDNAVTLAYALASRLSRDKTRAIGDKDDDFGAIGANGAVALDAADLVPASASASPLVLKPGKVCNLQCDAVIKGHMDVTNAKVGALVAAALSS